MDSNWTCLECELSKVLYVCSGQEFCKRFKDAMEQHKNKAEETAEVGIDI